MSLVLRSMGRIIYDDAGTAIVDDVEVLLWYDRGEVVGSWLFGGRC